MTLGARRKRSIAALGHSRVVPPGGLDTVSTEVSNSNATTDSFVEPMADG